MAFISVATQMVALAAITGVVVAPSSRTSPPAVVAPALLSGPPPGGAPAAENKLIERLEVPSGAAQCPNSGAGAACTHATAAPQAGSSAGPTGLLPFPTPADKPGPAPGACGAAASSPTITAGGSPGPPP